MKSSENRSFQSLTGITKIYLNVTQKALTQRRI